MRTYTLLMVAVVSSGLLLVGCAKSNPLDPVSPVHAVDINKQYMPAALTISPGDSVEWKNTEGGTHTVTSGTPGKPDGIFDSGDIAPGGTFKRAFNAPGTFLYYSTYSRSMTGTVMLE